jgi:hypothetical protein
MFNAVPIKIPMAYITEIENSSLKFIWKHKSSWIAKIILSKKSNTGDIKLYYKVIAIKAAWYWHKNRHESRIEDPVMNPWSYIHLIFDKGTKNIWWRKDSLFKKCCWENWISVCRKLKLNTCWSPCTSINSKWIKDLIIRPETLKLVKKRARHTLESIGIGNEFFSRTQLAQQLRERNDKWNNRKQKTEQQKKWSINWRRHPQNGRKSLPAVHQTKDW